LAQDPRYPLLPVFCEFKLASVTDVPDNREIVCVAGLIEQKGHHLLLEAVAALARQGVNVKLTLIGDGPLRSDIEAAIIERDLQNQVSLVGWQSSAEVMQTIQASRAFVLSSLAEGLPVSLMEAMALARPVISSDVGAISELVKNRVHGWLVTPGSIEQLTEALRQMLETPIAKLTEMGREARIHVLQRHDADQECSKLASLIMSNS
jgi:glycosyltransferase involved in cell wall biosynthesis